LASSIPGVFIVNTALTLTPYPATLEPIANQTDVRRAVTNATDRTATQIPIRLLTTPSHDPLEATRFLKALDPGAKRFTFQFIRDPKLRKTENNPRGLRPIHHSSPDEAFALMGQWNTPEHGYGLYVTINETDLLGRARENIIRVRAVYIDVDEDPEGVVARLQGLLAPSAIIKSSRGHLQIYWWVDDAFPLDQFEHVQRALISKLGTDPQVHDLPRVMRLPGSLHLKGEPQLVTMRLGNQRRHPFGCDHRGARALANDKRAGQQSELCDPARISASSTYSRSLRA
jgi:hypothetical protein